MHHLISGINFLSHSASLAQIILLVISHTLIRPPPAHHSHPPSHIHCFIPGSKLTFSTNLFHHSLKHFYTLVTAAVYLSIYCTQPVPLTRSNAYRNVRSRLLAGLVTVEQTHTTASFARDRGIELRRNDLLVTVTQPGDYKEQKS